jgi:hypothetical protein
LGPRLAAPSLAIEAAGNPHAVATLVDEFMRSHVRCFLKHPCGTEMPIKASVLPDWRHRDARTITPRDVIELLDA